MTRLLLLLPALSLTVGCAYANMFASKPSAQVEFADSDAPAGEGWYCFDRNDGSSMDTICERTAELCDAGRRREQGAGASVGVCAARERAFCFYQDIDPTQAAVLVPVGERHKQYGCFGMQEQCEDLRGQHARNSSTGGGVVAVSACRELG